VRLALPDNRTIESFGMAKRTLEDFFDAVRASQRANREIYSDWYAIIARIDDCFVRAGDGLNDPESLMAAIMLLRCQYAFKAAAAMALAGQAADVFPVLRSVLEYAGYCLLIYETPSLERVFILRHAGDAEKAEQRRAFQSKTVKEAVSRHCTAALTILYDDLYQRTIDFGAHPNPHAIISTTLVDESGGEKTGEITTFAITKEPEIVLNALTSAAQIGLVALHVLDCVFKARFERLGIHHEMEALSIKTGLL
jgi:hypothetical protein